jgi:hypothetical protein
MEHQPTTLDTYRDKEHRRAAGTILTALDEDGDHLSFGQCLTAVRHLHFEGWRRRHQIIGSRRDEADELPVGSLIQEDDGTYRVSYYFTRPDANGEPITSVFFKRLESDHPGTPSRALNYPITVLDTP